VTADEPRDTSDKDRVCHVHPIENLALEGAIDDDTPDPMTSHLLPAMLRLSDVSPTARD